MANSVKHRLPSRYLGKVLGVENLTEPQAKYAEETLKQAGRKRL